MKKAFAFGSHIFNQQLELLGPEVRQACTCRKELNCGKMGRGQHISQFGLVDAGRVLFWVLCSRQENVYVRDPDHMCISALYKFLLGQCPTPHSKPKPTDLLIL